MSKFKIGDLVECKPGYLQEDGNYVSNKSGGAGYIPGLQFVIEREITTYSNPKANIIWLKGGSGIFEQALKLVNNKEFDYEIY